MVYENIKQMELKKINDIMFPVVELMKHLRISPNLDENGMIEYHQIKQKLSNIKAVQKKNPAIPIIIEVKKAIDDFEATHVDLDYIFESLNDLKNEDLRQNGDKKYQSWMEILYYHYFTKETQEAVSEHLEFCRATLNTRKRQASNELIAILKEKLFMTS